VPIRIGTRASKLARWQADWVAGRLRAEGTEVELVLISTAGDRQPSGPIEQIGTQGVFTKELQRALLDGRIDLAVHSLKDLPTDAVPGLTLAAVPERASSGDAWISREGYLLRDVPEGSSVGTGSLRRRAQLLYARPDLRMHDVRGNVDTRLARLADRHYDAIVLAEAGLQRLELSDQITEVLSTDLMLPAPGQGALGLETREDDHATRAALAALDDRPTHEAVLAERSLLASLRGGCLAPIAAWGHWTTDDELHLAAVVLSPDGRERLDFSLAGRGEDAEGLGREVAEELLAQGAAELIEEARTERKSEE